MSINLLYIIYYYNLQIRETQKNSKTTTNKGSFKLYDNFFCHL